MRYDEAMIGPRGDAVWEDHAFQSGQDRPAVGQNPAKLYHP
jgi:hypothetical protein